MKEKQKIFYVELDADPFAPHCEAEFATVKEVHNGIEFTIETETGKEFEFMMSDIFYIGQMHGNKVVIVRPDM